MALSGLSWEMIVASVCTLRENFDQTFATTSAHCVAMARNINANDAAKLCVYVCTPCGHSELPVSYLKLYMFNQNKPDQESHRLATNG